MQPASPPLQLQADQHAAHLGLGFGLGLIASGALLLVVHSCTPSTPDPVFVARPAAGSPLETRSLVQ